MSATRRLPQISLLLGAAGLSIAVLSKETFRERFAKALGVNVPGGIWRLLAVFLAVVNLKNLPFVWHYRLFRSLIYHLFIQPDEIKPQDLFKPVIQTTHTPWAETDYNFHKSNSTYFTDLDIARTALTTAILRKGIRNVGSGPDDQGATFSFRNTSRAAGHKRRNSINPLGTSGAVSGGKSAREMTEEEWFEQARAPGALLVALGAVTCNFHKEIAPYRRYEIWTRLLTWDRKWLYIVSHFVEAGTFKPTGYALQPGRKGQVVEALSEEDKARLKKRIFASSVAKYVVKKGRLTIPPEMVLERSQMLPTRPAGTPVLGGWTPGPSKEGTPEKTLTPDGSDDGQQVLEESLFPSETTMTGGDPDWTWEMMQEQRLNGLKLAQAFDSLDGLKDVFQVEGDEALGRYTDLFLNF